MEHHRRQQRTSRQPHRIRVGPRTNLACVYCKGKKLRCDHQVPTCSNCQRHGQDCLVEDPVTKRRQPRNYLETLEERVTILESLLQQERSTVIDPSGTAGSSQLATPMHDDPEIESNDLTSKAGMLCVKASGAEPEPVYFGSSSAFAFSRLVHACFRQDLPSKTSRRHHSSSTTTPPSPCALPDYESGLVLSNAYFNNIHHQYPFLHEPTFRDWEKQVAGSSATGNDLGTPVPLFFVYMVYAIGAFLVPNPCSQPQRLYVSALVYVDSVFSLKSLEAIQGVLCCAMYSIRSPTGPSVWNLSGLALRQCIELGYHRSTVRFRFTRDLHRLEMRKRAFWCAWAIDCTCALFLGRPLTLRLQEIDAELPSERQRDATSRLEAGNMDDSSAGQPSSTIALGNHFFRLRVIWGRIHDVLFSNVSVCRLQYATHQAAVEQIRADLDEWLNNAPPPPPKTGPDISFFPSQDWYPAACNETILLLYRGFLSDTEGTPDSVFLECMRAAENLCQTHRRKYLGNPINYTWQALHALFLAGLTYLHCLWACPAARRVTRYDDVSNMFTSCTMLLAVVAERWEGTEPYRDLFEALSRRALRMMVDSRNAETVPPMVGSTDPEAEDISQWLTEMGDQGMLDGFDTLLSGLLEDFNPQDLDLFTTETFP